MIEITTELCEKITKEMFSFPLRIKNFFEVIKDIRQEIGCKLHEYNEFVRRYDEFVTRHAELFSFVSKITIKE